VVYAKVVGNTHSPGKEFAFFGITATAYRINNADENILENIFGQVFVLNQEQNRCVQFVFVAQYQDLQCV
jgi:hypothetical protein